MDDIGGEQVTPVGSTVSVTSTSNGPRSVIISLGGDIDISTVVTARESIDGILERDAPSTITFDLAALRFMDSSGLALLLTVAQQVESVEVLNPTGIVRRVIELSGLATTLPMRP